LVIARGVKNASLRNKTARRSKSILNGKNPHKKILKNTKTTQLPHNDLYPSADF